MIPTAILLGLVGGLTRFRWWVIPAVGIIWSITLAVAADPTMTFAQVWGLGLLFGSANAAVGVLVASAIVLGVRRARQGNPT